MRLLLVTSTVRTVGKGLFAEGTRIRSKTRVQDEVVLESFRALEASLAVLAFVLLLIAMHNL